MLSHLAQLTDELELLYDPRSEMLLFCDGPNGTTLCMKPEHLLKAYEHIAPELLRIMRKNIERQDVVRSRLGIVSER